jgi:hypothetical protein
MDPVQFDNLYLYKDNPRVDDRRSTLEGLLVHLIARETATKQYVPGSTLYKAIAEFITEDELDETLNRLEQRRTIIQETAEVSHESNRAWRTSQPLRARQYRIRVELFKRWLQFNRPLDEEALASFARRLARD